MSQSSEVVGDPANAHPLVLVVEDDVVVSKTVSYLLEDAGFRVATAVDGLDGLQKYRELEPDLVITDLRMPHKGGISLVMDLRRLGANAKIIAMSGEGDVTMDFVSVATTLGADYGLYKPFDEDQLVTMARRLTQSPDAAAAQSTGERATEQNRPADLAGEHAVMIAGETADVVGQLDHLDRSLASSVRLG